jgi:transposase-like protein
MDRIVGNGVLIKEEEKRRIIDLHFNQGKTIREVCRIMGKSSHELHL